MIKKSSGRRNKTFIRLRIGLPEIIITSKKNKTMKILQTNTATYQVKQKEDGTLNITHYDKPIENAGQFIMQFGGVEEVLARCKDYTEEEWTAEIDRQYAARKAARENALARQEKYKEQHQAEYKALLAKSEVIETTPENIGIVLRYLNDRNWGSWTLPKMSIGYSCHQYDCDGKQATTMTLDRPIEVDGEMVDKFKTGAPVRHLIKYHRTW